MKRLKEESFLQNFKGKLTNEFINSGTVSKGGDAMLQLQDLTTELPESENIIRKPKKKSDMEKLIGKTKMKLPIGKLYSIKKSENKEATGSGSAGGYEQPLFSEVTKKEVEEKWSQKYKNSIDCNNPKGFSQRAHCQGKKKKVEGKKTETKEATGSASSGSYVTPAAWAKSTKKKDWRGKSKTQIPGGKFVQVKKKCKKFPYCNQGDIKALKIFDNVEMQEAISKVSKKFGINEQIVRNIVSYELTNQNN